MFKHLRSTTKLLVAGLVLALDMLGTAQANADVIYTYTGNDFATAPSPFSITDKVSATLTFAAALADNLNFVIVNPIAFVISDVLGTLTNATASFGFFQISTDSSGNITEWFIEANQTNVQDIATVNTFPPQGTDIHDQANFLTVGGPVFAINSGVPGSWTLETVANVPEPGSLGLLGSSLLALALIRGKRKME